MRILAMSTGLVLLCAALMCGQEAQVERVVVPAGDSTRPRTVKASLMMGSITVKGSSGKDVIVEARPLGASQRAAKQSAPPTVDGMRRLDLGRHPGLDVAQENNVVTIKTGSLVPSDLVITVPVNTSLQLKCIGGGDISVDGVNGEIDANNMNGKVTLSNVSGTVVANSMNGAVTVAMNRVDAGKPMSFSTMNGNVDVTLPPDAKANVSLKTDHGDVYSDFEVRPDTAPHGPITEPNKTQDGRFRVHFDNAMRGTINGGGPEMQFRTYNGRIYIRKKK